MTPDPFILRVLSGLLPKELHHLVGDLSEEYAWMADSEGPARAMRHIAVVLLRSIPFIITEVIRWHAMMWSHYLKTSTRVISRSAVFSAINIFGLSVGMALCLLVLLFIADQRRYDGFHANADRTYRIISDYKSPTREDALGYATSPAPLAQLLTEQEPGIEHAVHVRDGFTGEFIRNDAPVVVSGLYVDSAFFETFDFPVVRGDARAAFSQPGSLLLTPETAEKLFGAGVDPTGDVLIAQGDRTYTIAGIVDPDPHTHLRFDALASLATLESDPSDDWAASMSRSYTYVVVDPSDLDGLEHTLERLRTTVFQDPTGARRLDRLTLQPLTDINLGLALANQVGAVIPRAGALFLGAFGLIIMIIAGFNYVSLTIARGTARFKEIGVRRTMGASTLAIFGQFLAEAVLIALVSLAVAAAMLVWLLPSFNSLNLISFSENQILIDLARDLWLYGLAIAFTVAVGLLAGLYPAHRFTRIDAKAVLAGLGGSGRPDRGRFRKIVTTTQFAFSIVFVVTSLMMLAQFRHMASTDYGFTRDHIVNVAVQDVPFDVLRTRLEALPSVVRVAGADKVPGLGSTNAGWLYRSELADSVNAHHFAADAAWLDVMGLDLLAGRTFDPERAEDRTSAVILGASAVTALGFAGPADAVGADLTVNGVPSRVIGVIADFISADPSRAGDPIAIRYQPDAFRYAVIETTPGGIHEAVAAIGSAWQDLASVHAPVLQVLNDELENNFIVLIFADVLAIFGVFAFFAILISCLGLFGMAMYAARHRIREIGIRQALGASNTQIALLLSRETLVMMVIGVVVGAPVAWYLNAFWLSNLSNAIEPGVGLVLAAIGLVILLATATVASQTVRAARSRVVENLRT